MVVIGSKTDFTVRTASGLSAMVYLMQPPTDHTLPVSLDLDRATRHLWLSGVRSSTRMKRVTPQRFRKQLA